MTIASQTIHDGDKHAVIKVTSSDEETAAVVIDVSGLADISHPGVGGDPVNTVAIENIWFTTQGQAVNLLWDATTDVLAWTLPADETGCFNFSEFGGLVNNAGAGITGDLVATTIGHGAGDNFTIAFKVRKKAA